MSRIVSDNGMYWGINVIQITTIPHISIINPDYNQIGAYEKSISELKKAMSDLYSSFHEFCYAQKSKYKGKAYINVELLWVTTPVQNQPYKANISMYIVLRHVVPSKDDCQYGLTALTSICENHLRPIKFVTKEFSLEDILMVHPLFGQTGRSFLTLHRDEFVSTLQSQQLPYCASYNTFEVTSNDLQLVVGTLSNTPNVALSITLTPTWFSEMEFNKISQCNHVLSNLVRGLQEINSANVSMTNATLSSQLYKYYYEHARSPLFELSINVFGAKVDAMLVATALSGHFRSGANSLKIQELQVPDGLSEHFMYKMPWDVQSKLIKNRMRIPFIVQTLGRLPFVITNEEASEIAYFPYATKTISAGLSVNQTVFENKEFRSGVITEGKQETDKTLSVGELSGAPGYFINISTLQLTKHLFVAGTPGMGKSVFSTSILHRLFKRNIPFLVIEPAKNEYRALIQAIPDLQVFTPGKDHISPLKLNPFLPPKNVKLSAYKSSLTSLFQATVSTSTTLTSLINETIDRCYADFGWLDHYTSDDGGKIFNISDFIKCFEVQFNQRGYAGRDNRDILIAGKTRLQQLLRYFDSYNSMPIENLLSCPTVIELNAIENENDKAAIMCYLLYAIFAYVNSNMTAHSEKEQKLENFIFIEEAHVLLDTQREVAEGQANPAAEAKKLILRMLKELRSIGVGVGLADQSPKSVGNDVVAMTGTKVAFRIVEREDREVLANSMNLSELQFERLGGFTVGEAFTSSDKYDTQEIRTENYSLGVGFMKSLSDDEIKELISKYWKNPENARLKIPYPECHKCKQKVEPGSCYNIIKNLAGEIAYRIYIEYNLSKVENSKKFVELLDSIDKNHPIIKSISGAARMTGLLQCVKIHIIRMVYYNTNIYKHWSKRSYLPDDYKTIKLKI